VPVVGTWSNVLRGEFKEIEEEEVRVLEKPVPVKARRCRRRKQSLLVRLSQMFVNKVLG